MEQQQTSTCTMVLQQMHHVLNETFVWPAADGICVVPLLWLLQPGFYKYMKAT
jgi:hypothetical protein